MILPIFAQTKAATPKGKCNPFKDKDCKKKGSKPASGGTVPKKPSQKSGEPCNKFKDAGCKKATFQPGPSKPTLPPSQGSGTPCNRFKEKCDASGLKPVPKKLSVKPPKVEPADPEKVKPTQTLEVTDDPWLAISRDRNLGRHVKRIYDDALKIDTRFEGKIVIEMQITPHGRLRRVKIIDNTTGDEFFAKDLANVFKRYVIPGYRAKRFVNVQYPFIFKPQNRE